MAFSKKIAESIETYLKEQDYSYDYDAFHGTFAVEAELSCTLHSCLVVLQVTEDAFISYAALYAEVPALRLAYVGEYLHRANYGLPNGNFELDYDDGSIHYKTFLDCPSEVPTARQLDEAFAVPLSVIDRYGDGLMKILGEELSLPGSIIKELDGQR